MRHESDRVRRTYPEFVDMLCNGFLSVKEYVRS